MKARYGGRRGRVAGNEPEAAMIDNVGKRIADESAPTRRVVLNRAKVTN